MKGKAIIPLVLGLGIGIVTVKLAVDTIRKARGENKGPAIIKAVRAKTDIGPQEEITAEMVELVETVDSLFAPANERVEKLKDVMGRVTAKAIPKYSAVLTSMLAPPGTSPGMVGQIKPGYRAFSVKINEVTGVAYQIKPGDWVDIVVVMDIASRGRRGKETISEVILEHIKVAAIGRGTNPQAGRSGAKVKPAKSATLLVREEEVTKLHLAASRGRISLVMRGVDDKRMEAGLSANLGDVIAQLENKGKKPGQRTPNRLPAWNEPEPEPYTVLIRRGSAASKKGSRYERITFETNDSHTVIAIKGGPPSKAAATLGISKQSSSTRRRTRPADSEQDEETAGEDE